MRMALPHPMQSLCLYLIQLTGIKLGSSKTRLPIRMVISLSMASPQGTTHCLHGTTSNRAYGGILISSVVMKTRDKELHWMRPLTRVRASDLHPVDASAAQILKYFRRAPNWW